MKKILFVVFILKFSLSLSFDKNIRNRANDVPPFEKVALIAITQNASDAIEFYRQNYQSNNQNAVEILNTASQILSGIGKIKEAEQLLQYGLKEHPANLTLLNSLGNTSAKLSKYDQAIDVYSKILELDSFATFFGFAQTDEEAIKNVVNSAYVQGIYNNGPVDDIRTGFHQSFSMLRLMDNEIAPLPIADWIASIEKRRTGGTSDNIRIDGKFVTIDITGNAATVKLDLYRQNKIIFTDYLSLYKFTEGWKIVCKTFYRHP